MYLCYQVCFFTGILFIGVLTIFGGVLDLFDLDGFDLDFDLVGVDIMLPSPMVCMTAVTVFGGIGMIFTKSYPSIPLMIVLLISIITSILAGTFINKCILRPLKKAENTSVPEMEELEGICAVVTETIPGEGYGEISYCIHGNSFLAPAKSENKDMILKGTEVAICWIKDYVFYVVRLDEEGEEKGE